MFAWQPNENTKQYRQIRCQFLEVVILVNSDNGDFCTKVGSPLIIIIRPLFSIFLPAGGTRTGCSPLMENEPESAKNEVKVQQLTTTFPITNLRLVLVLCFQRFISDWNKLDKLGLLAETWLFNIQMWLDFSSPISVVDGGNGVGGEPVMGVEALMNSGNRVGGVEAGVNGGDGMWSKAIMGVETCMDSTFGVGAEPVMSMESRVNIGYGVGSKPVM